MNDTEITETEEDRLRLLLRRAADNVAVTAADEATLAVEPPAPQRARLIPAAAAAALVVVIVGTAFFVLSGGDDERIDTVPATTGEPQFSLQSGTGPWRLPAERSNVEVLEANELSFPPQFGFAVDDPADPTRWAAVMSGGFYFGGQEANRTETLPDGTVVSIYEPGADSITGATWMTVTNSRTGTGLLNVAYRGLSDTEAIAAVQGVVEAMPNRPSSDQVPAIVSNLSASIEPAGGASQLFIDVREPGADRKGFGFQARIHPADGRQLDPVTVQMFDTGLPPAVAGLEDLLIVEASRAAGGFEPEVIDRPDLGPGAFTLITHGIESPFLYDADGTSIRVSNAAMNGAAPASLGDQLQLVSSLVPMTREDVEVELTRRGISGIGTGTEMATTTTEEVTPTTVASGP